MKTVYIVTRDFKIFQGKVRDAEWEMPLFKINIAGRHVLGCKGETSNPLAVRAFSTLREAENHKTKIYIDRLNKVRGTSLK